jgi:hypothetical protein
MRMTKLRQCSVLRSISCRTTSRSRTGVASYNVVESRRKSRNIVALVPRGGIELSPIGLKLRHFSNDDFPVYPLMYPAFRTIWQRQKPFVYVRCAHFNGQSLAQAMFRELDRCPPKAKVTHSNRVGCAKLKNGPWFDFAFCAIWQSESDGNPTPPRNSWTPCSRAISAFA